MLLECVRPSGDSSLVNLNFVFPGPTAYDALNFTGTWFVESDQGSDYIGFVFGYQTNRKFYVVLWRRTTINYGGSAYRAGIKGLQIKVSGS